MTRDFEERLRQSLQARAADVTPDPAMFAAVQSRIRRRRFLRWSLAGAGAVAMVAVAALAVPSVLDRRVEFEPGPLATQPPSEAHSYEQAAPPCSGEDDALVAVVARDGGLGAMCASGTEEPLTAARSDDGVASSPALSPDGRYLAYAVAADHEVPESVEVFDLVANEPAETIENANSPAYSAAGHLAFVRDEPGDGQQPLLVVREVGNERSSPMAPDIPEEFAVRHLVWGESPTPRMLYWEAQYEGTTVWVDDYLEDEPRRYDVVGGGNYAAPSSRDEQRLHLLRTCCVSAKTVELGALTLPDTQAPFEPITQLPADFNGRGTLSLAAAGTADIDEATGAWRSGAALAWLVGDGDRLYLVDEDGDTGLVAEGVFSVAFNPAADLPHSEDGGPEEPETLAQVDVFFTQEGGECGESVQAYPRSAEGPGVLRGALTQLLAGPTPQEIAAGAAPMGGFGAETAGALNDVSIGANGVARVDFSDFGERFPGTSCSANALFSMLEPTVRQFPSVKEVVYSFDGDIEAFYSRYQMAAPPHRPDVPLAVTRTADRIRDAARARDYDALAELTDREKLSCSFSDQNEDCIAVWQEQERRGEDPLGVMVEVLEGEPAKNPNAPIWAWPVEYIDSDEYLGPRLGIDRNGVWRFFVQGGD